MSAFFVGHDHIDALLSAAKALKVYVYLPGLTPETAVPAPVLRDADWSAIGRELLEENRKSLAARYPEDAEGLVSEGVGNYAFAWVDAFEDYSMPLATAAANLIRLADCYDYQACEHDGWETSWSKGFTLRLVFAASKELAKVRPESFPCWSFSRERAAAARKGRA